MNARATVVTLLGLGGLGLLGLLGPTACTRRVVAPPNSPSVLLISLDTVGAEHLSLYGGRARMPALEALAHRGTVLDQAWSQWPETGLSHWSMFTGVLPEVHGDVPRRHDSAYTGPTLTELLRDQGWETGAFIGGLTMIRELSGLDRGFDTWKQGLLAPGRDAQGGSSAKGSLLRRPAAEVVAEAGAWIAGRDAPWFAFVHLFDAHFPYEPAQPGRYDPEHAAMMPDPEAALRPARDEGAPLAPEALAHAEALYDATLTELDEAIAPLLGQVGPDVLVVVVADHGESFDETYLFNHRGSLAPEVLRVPFVAAGPGVPVGRRDTLVGLTDLFPFVVGRLGLPTPDLPVDGRDPLAERPNDRTVFARTDPWVIMVPGRPQRVPLFGVKTPASLQIWDGQGVARAWPEGTPLLAPAERTERAREYATRLRAAAPLRTPGGGEASAPPGLHGG